MTVPAITTLFLSTLFTSATDFLGTKPTSCVISAPAWFTPAQIEALRLAAKDAGINVVQVLDEAAAVLVGYRVGLSEERKERGLLGKPEEGEAGEVEKRDKKVVVLDMGETSLAVTIVSVAEGEYSVLGRGREEKLGGREFDNLVRVLSSSGDNKLTRISCSSTLPRSSRKRQRSRSTCHAQSLHPTWTSAQRPNSVSPLSTPSGR
jgi:heat shock protein 1/8